jgi:hypothetical protein
MNVRITDVEVSGPAGDVESNLRSQLLGGARQCFNIGLARGTAEPGKASLVLDVGPGGDVTEARVDESDRALGSDVVTCLARRAKMLRLTAVDSGPATVRVGLVFTKPVHDAGP